MCARNIHDVALAILAAQIAAGKHDNLLVARSYDWAEAFVVAGSRLEAETAERERLPA